MTQTAAQRIAQALEGTSFAQRSIVLALLDVARNLEPSSQRLVSTGVLKGLAGEDLAYRLTDGWRLTEDGLSTLRFFFA